MIDTFDSFLPLSQMRRLLLQMEPIPLQQVWIEYFPHLFDYFTFINRCMGRSCPCRFRTSPWRHCTGPQCSIQWDTSPASRHLAFLSYVRTRSVSGMFIRWTDAILLTSSQVWSDFSLEQLTPSYFSISKRTNASTKANWVDHAGHGTRAAGLGYIGGATGGGVVFGMRGTSFLMWFSDILLRVTSRLLARCS